MATKHTDTALQKAADDEPIFVLRGQDEVAPATIELWADLADEAGAPADKVADARKQAQAMRLWQITHPTKVPD